MDSKNVLMAIVLSTLVLVFWATFFEPPPIEMQTTEKQTTESEETSSPSIETIETSKKILRNEVIKSVDRIKLENKNIVGSISLEGGIIDDVVFKRIKQGINKS